MRGHVYILINASIQGLKIGYSTKSPEERAAELSEPTGIPSPFVVAWDEQVADCEEVERLVHSRLKQFRFNVRREFFQVPLKYAIQILTEVAAQFRILDGAEIAKEEPTIEFYKHPGINEEDESSNIEFYKHPVIDGAAESSDVETIPIDFVYKHPGINEKDESSDVETAHPRTESATYKCPFCDTYQVFAIASDSVGEQFQCRACKRPLTARSLTSPVGASPDPIRVSPDNEEDESSNVETARPRTLWLCCTCPICRTFEFMAKDSIGKLIQCRKCERFFHSFPKSLT
jgi:T5orf172 domain-containing protein